MPDDANGKDTEVMMFCSSPVVWFGLWPGPSVAAVPRFIRYERSDLAAAVNRPAIPQQVDRAAHVAQEVPQKSFDIETREVVSATPEIEPSRRRVGDTASPLQTDSRSWRYR